MSGMKTRVVAIVAGVGLALGGCGAASPDEASRSSTGDGTARLGDHRPTPRVGAA